MEQLFKNPDFVVSIGSRVNTDNKINIPKSINTFYGDLKSMLNIRLITTYLDPIVADNLFEDLKRIPYNTDEQSMVKMGGKFIKIPRKQVAYGAPGTYYNFSGIRVEAKNWTNDTDTLQSLSNFARMIGRSAGKPFNFVLINNYLDQSNSIGYHSDDEKDLGDYPTIAGLSLGQEREMYFRSKLTNKVIKISLPHNSLIIMHYPTNSYWEHSIPKTTRKLGQRISLTFRHINI